MALEHLILMRHAKSSWNHEGLTDHQRPLNKRGRKAARAIGSVLQARKLVPDHIWSSDSERTRETVAHAFPDMDITPIWKNGFYHASANQILYVCGEQGEPASGTLLLMGHNPGWEDLLFHFSGMSRRMPTGACAIFKRTDANADWLESESWQLVDVLYPRDFEQ
ncbi:MAG: histidine phosphatase family protein [Robiginitomaculum sp.]|nr:histidine phosphatase family protein [Robiginitomaculum sp.]